MRWGRFRLRIGCSTTELPRPLIIKNLFPCLASCVQLALHSHRPLWVSALRCLTSDRKCTTPLGTILCSADRRSPRSRFRNTHAFPDVPKRIRSRTRQKKDSKLILTLSNSFRKVLILRVLASSTAFNRLWPEKTSTTKRGDPFNYILTATINIYWL